MRIDVPHDHRRWILRNAIAVTAVVNLAVNGATAWASAAGAARVPLWAAPIAGGPSTITDTLGTLFLLPAITSLLMTTAVRRDLRAGRLPALPVGAGGPRMLQSRPLRGLALGGVCVAALGPPLVAILAASGFGDISPVAFVGYKALLGVALGALVTPPIALYAMLCETPATRLR
jgi:hypothetical protein